MPIYAYSCPDCAASRDVFKHLDALDRAEPCELCGAAMHRQIVAPAIATDLPGYSCPVSGRWIEGRRAHRENLRKHGCRLLEPGEAAESSRRRAQADAALEESVAETAERLVEALPTEKRERLAAEMQAGLDVEIVRN